MNYSRFLILKLLCFSLKVFSQNEANIWYYEKAGLDFNSGTPAVLANNWMAWYFPHSTSCIADTNGNLLFFTEGEDVWNRNMQIMVNGTGLEGDKFDHQSSINGKLASLGVYTYVISYSNMAGEVRKKTGMVTIVR